MSVRKFRLTGVLPPVKLYGCTLPAVICTIGTSCVHDPFLPGFSPAAFIRSTIYATVLASAGVVGARPS